MGTLSPALLAASLCIVLAARPQEAWAQPSSPQITIRNEFIGSEWWHRIVAVDGLPVDAAASEVVGEILASAKAEGWEAQRLPAGLVLQAWMHVGGGWKPQGEVTKGIAGSCSVTARPKLLWVNNRYREVLTEHPWHTILRAAARKHAQDAWALAQLAPVRIEFAARPEERFWGWGHRWSAEIASERLSRTLVLNWRARFYRPTPFLVAAVLICGLFILLFARGAFSDWGLGAVGVAMALTSAMLDWRAELMLFACLLLALGNRTARRRAQARSLELLQEAATKYQAWLEQHRQAEMRFRPHEVAYAPRIEEERLRDAPARARRQALAGCIETLMFPLVLVAEPALLAIRLISGSAEGRGELSTPVEVALKVASEAAEKTDPARVRNWLRTLGGLTERMAGPGPREIALLAELEALRVEAFRPAEAARWEWDAVHYQMQRIERTLFRQRLVLPVVLVFAVISVIRDVLQAYQHLL